MLAAYLVKYFHPHFFMTKVPPLLEQFLMISGEAGPRVNRANKLNSETPGARIYRVGQSYTRRAAKLKQFFLSPELRIKIVEVTLSKAFDAVYSQGRVSISRRSEASIPRVRVLTYTVEREPSRARKRRESSERK